MIRPYAMSLFLKSKLQIIKLLYRIRNSFWYASLVVVDVFAIFLFHSALSFFIYMYIVYRPRFWWLLTRPSKCTVDKKQNKNTLCILNCTNPSRFTNSIVKNVCSFTIISKDIIIVFWKKKSSLHRLFCAFENVAFEANKAAKGFPKFNFFGCYNPLCTSLNMGNT